MPKTHPYKGVRQRRWGSWVSEICHPVLKTRIWLGSHKTAEAAARVYDEAARLLSGPAARTNFPGSYTTGNLTKEVRAKLEECPVPPSSSSTTAAAPAPASSSPTGGAMEDDDVEFVEAMIREMTDYGPVEIDPSASVRSTTN
ncbi:ethylene-responsive transcription factor ERF003 [Brachypodium distachyon]|uniref:AP2/ERF domain-containing protein n=1 Tax=Brachypodium distachyon TaxID=15368 RepID=I1J2V2_BRADI|nr:ethylene-responsive transcription factor ERF003 [Brachypodium distachyon]KQJ85072.1 hypothetical protein BRADI_5g24700v3 [Brachypodium distachyon]|eukprot:XP_010227322.1 ethylene-responsive transcription factor ERF003 [Brachypodium distachyon]